jgi:glucosamine--fructose-6-phosphate aminotransferase (isomerizing)
MDSGVTNKNYTYREIKRQQKGWKAALESLEGVRSELLQILEKYNTATWIFSGCGTSYYLAQTASIIFEMITGFRCKSVASSEILMFPESVFNSRDGSLLIPISRSGITTEVVKAAQFTRDHFNIPTLAISCDPDSTLIKESELKLTFPFERENSVVMTGSFTTMVMSLIYLASLRPHTEKVVPNFNEVADISTKVVEKYESFIEEISNDPKITDFVFLGHGPFYGIANEAALKVQEMSISPSQSFHALEYRHGPMSTASQYTLITVLCSQGGQEFERPLIHDLKQLGAKILVFMSNKESINLDIADYVVTDSKVFGDIFNPVIYIPLLQLLGYYKALAKNIDPDTPKNLSAVVKLEI